MTTAEMETEVGRLGREIERLKKLLCAIAGDANVQRDPTLVRPGFLEFRTKVRANLARRRL